MKRAIKVLLCLGLLTSSACNCRPEIRGYSIYDSSIEHSKEKPAAFTVFNTIGRYGVNSASSSEIRPEYSEVYVFDESQDCKYYDYEKSDCPIVWKAVTHPKKSPWKIAFGKDGEHLRTVKGPEELIADKPYRIVVALRLPGSKCISEFGSHTFSFRKNGKIKPVENSKVEGYVPLPDTEASGATKQPPFQEERLKRLAKQYEKLNGHPLLALSYGREMSMQN